MITCKEDLINTYIINDEGELRKKYIFTALAYGVEVYEGDLLKVEDFDADYLATRKDYYFDGYYCFDDIEGYKQLTLADFIPSENALQSPVDDVTLDTHIHTLEENKRSTGAPMPFIVEDGSVSDTRKDIFKEILTLARENNCFIQFDGLTEDEDDSIVMTFASSDDEFVVQGVDEFRELVDSINTTQKFLRGL
ncbi:TPA: hypothetical protein ACOAY7_002949 [Vibrio cholerae]|nr:hypothetical protein 2017DRC32_0200 [Vibrio phage ICP1]QVV97896.1 hypothetical protein 2017DRC48_0200 [Vibrio phage ICP1]QVV98123.1 hypothetical protein 2017DRC55_0200 [Vibrio phage ICP1]QVV98349.1 hypothetical protein 2017DRC72_0195 [Vibrio phage ICP1]QVV98576.1 hypothetical protein 2017DRC74_0195 [Vibrio phage ICP1]